MSTATSIGAYLTIMLDMYTDTKNFHILQVATTWKINFTNFHGGSYGDGVEVTQEYRDQDFDGDYI